MKYAKLNLFCDINGGTHFIWCGEPRQPVELGEEYFFAKWHDQLPPYPYPLKVIAIASY